MQNNSNRCSKNKFDNNLYLQPRTRSNLASQDLQWRTGQLRRRALQKSRWAYPWWISCTPYYIPVKIRPSHGSILTFLGRENSLWPVIFTSISCTFPRTVFSRGLQPQRRLAVTWGGGGSCDIHPGENGGVWSKFKGSLQWCLHSGPSCQLWRSGKGTPRGNISSKYSSRIFCVWCGAGILLAEIYCFGSNVLGACFAHTDIVSQSDSDILDDRSVGCMPIAKAIYMSVLLLFSLPGTCSFIFAVLVIFVRANFDMANQDLFTNLNKLFEADVSDDSIYMNAMI